LASFVGYDTFGSRHTLVKFGMTNPRTGQGAGTGAVFLASGGGIG
jgi:hypothetical protein